MLWREGILELVSCGCLFFVVVVETGEPGFMGQVVMNRWRDNERQNHRNGDAADNSDRERLQHLRSGANGQGEWQHSCYRSQRRHKDGTKPTTASLNH